MNKFNKSIFIQFKNKRFYLITLSYLLIFLLILLISFFSLKEINKIENSFSVAAFVTLAIIVLSLIFRFGFMEKTFIQFKNTKEISNEYNKQKKMIKMTYEEKKVYLERLKQKKKPKTKKPHFPFFFNLFLYLIISIIILILILV
ncbi:uncharacterized protein DUF3899 [Mycoplasmopsis mustelae]|uniref:Uncharacterized protein DUF3899 n=1 Tax=Mycoplasmopsis mustelae TaxID=171289 RepID=A0A4R7UD72_9BACT|nr:DUF3899 domain-containing protein [Mycoplasmopsis mustelae]TDV24407.1 uncharacterized protein DUF3899 [Mycoplasmopsis mustelae]